MAIPSQGSPNRETANAESTAAQPTAAQSTAAQPTAAQSTNHAPAAVSPATALSKRFGTAAANRFGAVLPAPADSVIPTILAHRSVRKFLPTPIPDDTVTLLVQAAQSASTSSHLQSFSVVAVRDPERKDRLAQLSGDQQFIRDAPIFLLWVADLGRVARLAEERQQQLIAPQYLEGTILGVVDAALAAQTAAIAAESLGLGLTYVGGARNHPVELAAELALPQGAVVVFGMALGYPDPTERADIKPRLSTDSVLHFEQYDRSQDRLISEHDDRQEAYNRSQDRSGDWSSRAIARLGRIEALAGRETLRADLDALGFPSR